MSQHAATKSGKASPKMRNGDMNSSKKTTMLPNKLGDPQNVQEIKLPKLDPTKNSIA